MYSIMDMSNAYTCFRQNNGSDASHGGQDAKPIDDPLWSSSGIVGPAAAETHGRDEAHIVLIAVRPEAHGVTQLIGLELPELLEQVHLWLYAPSLFAERLRLLMQRDKEDAAIAHGIPGVLCRKRTGAHAHIEVHKRRDALQHSKLMRCLVCRVQRGRHLRAKRH